MDQARLSHAASLADYAVTPFVQRAPWWGGDLQTLCNFIVRRRSRIADFPQQRLMLPLADGSGDTVAAMLGRPRGPEIGRPLVVLVHGLTGEETSFYMRRTAEHLLALGYPVLRLNLRGAGPSRPFCRGHYHAGRSEDLALALAALPAALTTSGIVAVGYSLGANMLLKFLGERRAAVPVCAAAAVSAPLDLAGTARRMMRLRNRAYQAYLLKYMRAEAVAPIAALSAGERRAVLAARSIWEFDDCYSAPRNGFSGAADYYERCAARPFIASIAVPTLVIHALDDPWIPPEPYLALDWHGNAHLFPLITRHGGHVGFEGRDRHTSWHDLAIARFFEAIVSRR